MAARFARFLHGNALALLALFVALGGTTYAASGLVLPRNSVGARQLKTNAVINPKIKNGAVTGLKIANNSVKGVDVDESSLGQVPLADNAVLADRARVADSATDALNALNAVNATNAGNAVHAASADAVGGMAPAQFSVKGPGSSGPFTMVDLAGLRLTLSCDGSANPVVTATNDSASVAELQFVRVSNTNVTVESGSLNFQPNDSLDVLAGTKIGHVSFAFYRLDGRTVTGQFGFDGTPAFGSFLGCAAGGNALAG
jgi:hypothetical protein